MITKQQREELIEAVDDADLVCPEQVCEMVIAAGESKGYDAAIEMLEKCMQNDASEKRSLGIE
jgi:hypothetical protein